MSSPTENTFCDYAVFRHSTINSLINEGVSFSLTKHDRTTTVGIIRGAVIGFSHDLLIKRFNYRGVLDFLAQRLFKSRARRLWEINHAFYTRGLSVSAPVAYIEPSLKEKDSIYIGSAIEYAENLAKMYKKGLLDEDRQLAQKLAGTVAEWHLSGAVHGDLKWSNILVQRNENSYRIFLVDLDHAALHSAPHLNGMIKDLTRFYRYSIELDAAEWVNTGFFPEYVNLLPDTIKNNIDIKRIIDKARKEFDRKGQRRL